MALVIEDYFRSTATGTGINGRIVSLRRQADNVEIATATTANDANGNAGYFSFDLATVGYPGPVYYMVDDGTGQYKRHSGRSVGQVGRNWLSNVIDVIGDLGTGVTNGLAVTAPGSGMSVTVASGRALLKDAIAYIQEANVVTAISAAHPTLPRIDRVILRVKRAAAFDMGKITLMVLQGTAASVPAAPALTTTVATWDLSLAQVLVDAGATVIASGKVTDERDSTALGQGVLSWPVTAADLSNEANFSTTAIAKILKAGVSPSTLPVWAQLLTSELADFDETAPSNGQVPIWNAGSGKYVPGSVATGDASTNTATSVDSELPLFSGTTGKLLKRGNSFTGMIKLIAGVVSIATGADLPSHGHAHAALQPGVAVLGYGSTSVGTSTVVLCTATATGLDPASTYDVLTISYMTANAPSSGFLRSFSRASASGSSRQGTQTGTVGGERGLFAFDWRQGITGVSSTEGSARANTDTGTGSVNDAIAIVIPFVRNV